MRIDIVDDGEIKIYGNSYEIEICECGEKMIAEIQTRNDTIHVNLLQSGETIVHTDSATTKLIDGQTGFTLTEIASKIHKALDKLEDDVSRGAVIHDMEHEDEYIADARIVVNEIFNKYTVV